MKTRILLILLSLMLIVGVVVIGCAAPAPPGEEEETVTPTVPAEEEEEEETPTAPEQEVTKWTFYNLMTTGPIWANTRPFRIRLLARAISKYFKKPVLNSDRSILLTR